MCCPTYSSVLMGAGKLLPSTSSGLAASCRLMGSWLPHKQ